MSRNNGKRPQMEAKPTTRLRGGSSSAAAAHGAEEEEFPAAAAAAVGGRSSTSSSSTSRSPASSCVSSEGENAKSSSPEAAGTTSMVLAGCPRCLMYVMLSEEDPKCPKCNSTVLLDFQHGNKATTFSTPKNNSTKK